MDNGEKIEEKNTENKTDSVDPNKYMKIKKFHFIILIFLIVILTTGMTAFVLSFGDEKVVEKIQIQDRKDFTKLYETFESIKANYIHKVDDKKLIEGAINGMVESLGDPYSDYMTSAETEEFNETISSSFEGIGAQVEQKDDHIVIVAPIKGSPAEKAGLKANDIILEVDGKSIQGMSSNEAVSLIRGEKGTKVNLKISRPGVTDPIELSITRDVIPVETVYSEMLDGQIGKIQITMFSERTYTELVSHINELKKQGMKGLILDLRQNPGGLLDQAIEISSLFVPNGKVIYQMEKNDGKKVRQLSNQKEPFNIPLVAVVDGGSASASEILAGALKESAGVPIVGEKTFGKGTAQTAASYNDGSTLKLTTGKWLTPSGKWINEQGIVPDYEVKMPEYANLTYVDPGVELKKKSINEQVSTIEKMLEALGYQPGTIDGAFDDETEAAVIKFQKDHGLEQTGVVTGDTTVQIMEALRNKLIAEDPQIAKSVEILNEKIK
ncbi:S41 family peptidase [Caldifermentibacillus hisashii]|uniref:C-terminal processing peptidase n=1 Tax=Caldibacillus thermoamylovorans TaxID=35841 RepID=A0ABD4A779_9BACI|nr:MULTISPECIES: S41 family peptidase [Bacillaceae]KIO63473.1 Carboxyl-terminal protease [Caldibacillus thermoamylovorans]KIO72833.1 Carboxyl-terminal protease [Caldibacillus thermoamylovorans]